MTKPCLGCGKVKELKEFSKANSRRIGVQSKCKACNSAYRLSKLDRINDYNKAYYSENKESLIASQKTRDESRKALISLNKSKYYWENKQRISDYKKAYRGKNRGKINASVAKRDYAKIQRTPKWLSQQQLKEIESFYILAAECAWLNNGEKLHVDHIVPLQGTQVSGLHVPWNLQILPAAVNIRKSNKLCA